MTCVRSAAAIVAVAVSTACGAQVSLGDPDSGAAAPPPPITRCSAGAVRLLPMATLQPGWGALVAMGAREGAVHLVFERGAERTSVLARIGAPGAPLVDVAATGRGPSRLALDARFAYVASAGTAEVHRIDRDGVDLIVREQPAATAIVADGRGRAYWAVSDVATGGRVVTHDFRGAPSVLFARDAVTSLAITDTRLYAAGGGRIDVADLTRSPPTLQALADRCGAGTIAAVGSDVYCAGADGTIVRIDPARRVVTVADGQTGAADVVYAGGRVFWRTNDAPGRDLLVAHPLDAIGGPTVVEVLEPGPPLLATDGCDLYFVSGDRLLRRTL